MSCTRHILAPLLILAVWLMPARAAAQGLPDLLGAVRQGGGWISIPVEQGAGSFLSTPVPTVGVELSGCFQIWWGHSGRWDILVEDTYGDGKLKSDTKGGESVPFSYGTGPWGQLQVNVRWSEPRDTTLLVWVGLGEKSDERDPCEPVYGGGE